MDLAIRTPPTVTKMALKKDKKSVVVQCGTFNRVVGFETSVTDTGRSERELLEEAIRAAYSERISPSDRLTLQIKSDEWDGMLIDFFDDHVQDRMKLTVVVEKVEVSSDACAGKKGNVDSSAIVSFTRQRRMSMSRMEEGHRMLRTHAELRGRSSLPWRYIYTCFCLQL